MRLLIIDPVKSPSTSFIREALPALESRFDEVRLLCSNNKDEIIAEAKHYDVIWHEFCTETAVALSNADWIREKRFLVRIHSYELFDTGWPRSLRYPNVDAVILPGPDLYRILVQTVPHAVQQTKTIVIPNGVNLELFAQSACLDPKKVAWVGHIELKKNPMLLLQIVDAMFQLDPSYSFHVAGEFTHFRTRVFIEDWLTKSPAANSIKFYGHVPDMPSWYRDKGVILSTSMHESFGLNIAEAMAVGASPVVYNFGGAELLWPAERLFLTVDEACKLIMAPPEVPYVEFIESRYTMSRWSDGIVKAAVG